MTQHEFVTDKLQEVRNKIRNQQIANEGKQNLTEIHKYTIYIESMLLKVQEKALEEERKRITPKGTHTFDVK
jgi:hypothetical protein